MARATFRRILVPYDFSVHATRALRFAARLAAERGARLTVLHVVGGYTPLPELPVGGQASWTPPMALVEDTRRELERVVRSIARGRGVRIGYRVVLGEPFDEIMAAALDADVIVMGTLGRSGLAHLLIGSVAEKVVRHSPVPVLTIRPQAGKRAKASKRRRRT